MLPWLISEGHGFQSATNLSTAKSHAVYISLFSPERWHDSFLPIILLKSRYGMIVAFSLSPPPTLSVQEMRFSSAWLHWSKPSFFCKAPFFFKNSPATCLTILSKILSRKFISTVPTCNFWNSCCSHSWKSDGLFWKCLFSTSGYLYHFHYFPKIIGNQCITHANPFNTTVY